MTTDERAAERDRLVEQLQHRGYCTRESTITAMRSVPRHAFVPADRRDAAYEDRPLPIGDGQTISAPHMVAMMVDLLELAPGDRVLEVGTGCGYHAAVVAAVVDPSNVFTIEVSPELADSARDRLESLGYGDISIRVGDGADGWAEHAPYDAVYLTCATPDIPDELVDQVRPGGRLLAPVGTAAQELVLCTIDETGVADREHHGGVRFVSMRSGPSRG